MSVFESETDFSGMPPVRELSRAQRRVLGVLIEKAFTVPESYPLTLKAATTGCNQKNNRAPITTYSEDAALEALDELRELGLVAVVHTESGRTERYRHYVRKRFPFSEPQIAILAELLLRGRQQLGELRARASRMAPIESLTELRTELDGLIAQGYVQSNGSLDRRGAEVDHALYGASENMKLAQADPDSDVAEADSPVAEPARAAGSSAKFGTDELQELRQSHQLLTEEVAELRQHLESVKDDLDRLRQSLGA